MFFGEEVEIASVEVSAAVSWCFGHCHILFGHILISLSAVV